MHAVQILAHRNTSQELKQMFYIHILSKLVQKFVDTTYAIQLY